MDRARRKQIITDQKERICCQLDMVTDVCNLSTGRDKQQDKEFENSLNYIVRLTLKSLKAGLYVSAKILT